MFIHGARAAVLRLQREGSLIGCWMNGLEARAPRNVLIVAMANKLARIAWFVLSSGEPIAPQPSLPDQFQQAFPQGLQRRTTRTKEQSNGVPENLRREVV